MLLPIHKVIKKINLLIHQIQIFGLNLNFQNRVKENYKIIFKINVLLKRN